MTSPTGANGDLRVGVYICHCGSNIAGSVDVVKVAKWAQQNLADKGVVVAKEYKFMCSSLGQKLIEEDIQKEELDRVVVAACSPHLHEKTFRGAAARAGLNPYLVEMASVREQVSWVTEDKAMATQKAKAMVSAAVARVREHQPLDPIRVPINNSTLVVGGGIAGIQASLEIANSGFHVYMVEREPSIGGHMAQFDKTFPTLDCAACILTPRMSEAGMHPNIELLTWSEVENVEGYLGNYTVTVRKKARYVDTELCTSCGICEQKCPRKVIDETFDVGLGYRKAIYTPFEQAVPKFPVLDRDNCTYFEKGTCRACEKFCGPGAIRFEDQDEVITLNVGNVILATGYDMFDARRIPRYGYGKLANVFTSLEFERMCNAAGPTNGAIVMRDGKTPPKSVGIIHCVGSRDHNYNTYCSSICCMQSLKFAHLVKERTGADVFNFYIDMRTAAKDYDEFYQKVLEEGTNLIRGKVAEVIDGGLFDEKAGQLIIQVEDTLIGKQRRIPVDMVVLATALEPRHDAAEVAHQFGISCSSNGWFTEKHPKLDPVATMTDGIFIAGCAAGPKDIPASVAQGSAAAARVISYIQQQELSLEPVRAWIDSAHCSGCRICNGLCPFNAISFDEEKAVSEVHQALCQGCGTCVAACPAGAITGTGFTNRQVLAQIEGLISIPVFTAVAEPIEV